MARRTALSLLHLTLFLLLSGIAFGGDNAGQKAWWSAFAIGEAPKHGPLSELSKAAKGPGALWREDGPVIGVAGGQPLPDSIPAGEDVKVMVADASGTPPAGIPLAYKPKGLPNLPEPFGRIRTNDNGMAVIRRMPGDSIVVWIDSRDYLPLITEIPAKVSEIKLRLVKSSQPVLRVTDEYGRELRGSHLVALPVNSLSNPISLLLNHKLTLLEFRGDEVGRIDGFGGSVQRVFAVDAPGAQMRAFSSVSEDGVIVLSPAAGIKIIARDAASHAPLKGASFSIAVSPDDLPWLVIKDDGAMADGEAWCAPPHYPCRLSVKVPGYVPISQEIGGPPGGGILTVSLPKGIELAGAVLDQAGRAISGASVSTGLALKDAWVQTDKDGKFSLPPLPPGNAPYKLRVKAEGYAETEFGPIRATNNDHIRIILNKGASINGLAVDADTLQPVSGSRVVIKGESSLTGLSADEEKAVAPDGTFSFSGLDPGDYRVQAWAENRTAAKASISLSKGEARNLGTLALSSHPQIRGKLLAPAESDLGPSPRVFLEPILNFTNVVVRDVPKKIEGMVAEDGKFRLEGVSPGHYRFLAEDGSNRKVIQDVTMASDDVDLGDVRLERSASINGQLVSRDGEDFTGWRIELFRQTFDLDPPTQFAGPDGGFAFDDLAAGQYYLKAFRPLNLAPAAGQYVVVQAGKDSSVVIPVGGVTLEVSLRVDGRPAAGASVVVASATGSFTDAGVVSIDSQYGKLLSGLPPSSNVSTANGAGIAEITGLQPGPSQATLGYQNMTYRLPVVIPSNSYDTATWDFRGLAISGRIYTPDGSPAQNATVSLAYDGIGVIPGTSARSDASGNFTLTGLGAGSAKLLAVGPNGLSASANISLSGDAPSPFIELRLGVH
jgi:hypothetical protein